MALQEKLDAMREMSKTRIPPEARAVMERSIDDLRASGIMSRVAGVGQPAPDFTLPDAAGRAGQPQGAAGPRPRRAVVLPRPLVTVLQRRAGGSQQALPEITDAGATLAVISPQVARTPRETEEPKPLSFELLRDLGNRVAEAYGLAFALPDDLREIYVKFGIDLAKGNGDGTWRLPMPARFVIDRGGIVRAVDADPDYTRRPEPARTVEILKGLRG